MITVGPEQVITLISMSTCLGRYTERTNTDRRLNIMQATAIVQVENERVVVTRWHFVPGAETGHHVHALDYVVVPLTSGTLRLEDGADARESRLEAGVSYANLTGTAHNVINANDYDFSFVEIELK